MKPAHEGHTKNKLSGKCEKCRVAFHWPRRKGYPKRLRDAACPRCGTPLKQTSRYLQWPWIFDEVPATRRSA